MPSLSNTCENHARLAHASTRSMRCNRSDVQVVYLVLREGLSSVFASQVAQPLASRAREGFRVHLGVFAPLGQLLRPALRQRWNALRAAMPPELAGRLTILPSPPTRLVWAWDEARTLRWWLRRRYGRREPIILHCRCAEMTAVALRATRRFPNARVIFDCRGDELAEFADRHGLDLAALTQWPADLRARYEHAEQLQRIAATGSDAVFCVSNAMVREMARRYPIPPERFAVVPCCTRVDAFPADPAIRARVRQRLGLADRFVVTYCGSLEWYQLADQAIRVFRLIRTMKPKAHLLAITTHAGRMRTALAESGVAPEESTVLSLPPHEVPEHLLASDVGLLLRHADAVNRVASPVKFAEYLASGTPVILTEGIGDYSKAVQEHRLGAVVHLELPDDELASELKAFLAWRAGRAEELRTACRAFAETTLSWSYHAHTTAAVYERLAERTTVRRLLDSMGGAACSNERL